MGESDSIQELRLEIQHLTRQIERLQNDRLAQFVSAALTSSDPREAYTRSAEKAFLIGKLCVEKLRESI